jgi:AraC family transcriptional regulator
MLLNTVMDPVAKAIWFIESHSSDPLNLDSVAQFTGLSRFHLTRAFGQVTGYSVMRYLKGRRLTEAARALAKGAPDILAVALDVGYGSHEAFTRSFRDQFGVTPETVRANGLDGLTLVDAFRRDQTMTVSLDQPRVEKGELLLVAGFAERITYDNVASIPQLWQKLTPHIGHLPNEIPAYAYGVKINSDNDGFEYLAGVGVSSFENLPRELRTERIPAQTYAVFTHRGHISTIRETMKAIWSEYLPQSGLVVVDAPDYERYGAAFDPRSGNGDVEIFIPIQT